MIHYSMCIKGKGDTPKGGVDMGTQMKRYVISVPKQLQVRLDSIKQSSFYAESWSEMARKLLEKGAEVVEKEVV